MTPSCPRSLVLTSTLSWLLSISLTFHSKTSLKTVPDANHKCSNVSPISLAQYLQEMIIMENTVTMITKQIDALNLKKNFLIFLYLAVKLALSP